MAGGSVLVGARVLGATVHGFPNRGHQEVARVHANSPRPEEWPEGAAVAAVAMAGGKEPTVARETESNSHETR